MLFYSNMYFPYRDKLIFTIVKNILHLVWVGVSGFGSKMMNAILQRRRILLSCHRVILNVDMSGAVFERAVDLLF